MGKWVCFWTAPTADPRPLRVPVNEDLQSPRWAGCDCDPCFKAGMMQRSQVVCSTPHTTTNCRTGLELNLFYFLPSPLSPLPSPIALWSHLWQSQMQGLKQQQQLADSLLENFPPCSSNIKSLWQWFLTESTKNGAPHLSSLQITVTYLVAGLGIKHQISVCCHKLYDLFFKYKGI